MIDKPKIVRSPARKTAMIRLTIPRHDIQKVMGPGIGEVMAATASRANL